MPGQPRRRSLRLAAKADADASTAEKKARKTAAKATGCAPKPLVKNLPSGNEGRKKRRMVEEATEVIVDKPPRPPRPPRKRESKSRAKKQASRRSLRIQAQKADKASHEGPKTSKNESSPSDVQTTMSTNTTTDRCLTSSPALESNPAPQTTSVYPKGGKFDLDRNFFAEYYKENPSCVGELSTPRGVKFDLDRNSFAEYAKEDPPSAVQLLTTGVSITASPELDDAKTRRNEGILAEWDSIFDDYLDENDDDSANDDSANDDSANDCCDDYYVNVTYRKRSRRSTIVPRRISMSP